MRTVPMLIAAGMNEFLEVVATDEPGSGNANHRYEIRANRITTTDNFPAVIEFQNGPIKEAGVNGISNEALLAIVADRLRGFQSGPFACRDNALALTHVETALLWLGKRTAERVVRGVEGTNQI